MKKRLIIASSLTFVITVIIAVTMRPSAVAQQDPPPTDGELQELSSETSPSTAEESAPDGTTEEEDASAEADTEEDVSAEGDTEEDVSAEADTEEDVSGEGGTEEETTAGEEDAATDAAESEGTVFDFDVLEGEEEVAVRHQDSETLSVDFPDEEIRSVLRTVADLFDLNLVVPETLVGRASIKLRDVTWRQVFDVVLSPVGYTYVEDGNIVKVVSLETLTLEPPVTEVVILDYAQAADILPTIQPLVNAQNGGRVQTDARSNALVITERPTQLRRIENIIEALDKPNVQVMIESKFIETRNRNLENIGVNWASLNGWGVQAGPFNRIYENERTRSGTSTRSEENIDVPFMQDGFGRASQVAGEPVGPIFTEDPVTGNRVYENMGPTSLDSSSRGTNRSRLDTAVFSADQFEVILSALKTDNDVKLVSNPTVVTLNNRQARIHIGEEFPIVLPRFNPQTGTYEAGEYDTIDIGIKLDVTPQVNNAGFINLDVEPDVSTLASTITYFGAEYPVRATRNARSFVTIKDGFTLAIGGLIQDDTLNVETRVPVLGSIPVLGRLFRSDSKDNDQRNLIIFLTARTLSPDGVSVEETVDPRMIHQMGIMREDLPGYRPDIEVWPAPAEKAVEEAPPAVMENSESDPEADAEAIEESEDAVQEDVDAEAEAAAESGEVELLPADATEADTAEEPAAEEDVQAEEAVSEPVTETPAAEPQPETRRRSGWLTP